MRLPNQTEATGRSRPRIRRTTIHAATRQPVRIASSATTPGRTSSPTSSSSWVRSNGRIIGRARRRLPRRAAGSRAREDAHVGGDAARERAQVVAALEARDDAARGVLVGHCLDLLGDPAVVVLDEAELAELVVAVRIEPGGDEDHLRLERVEALHPVFLDQ